MTAFSTTECELHEIINCKTCREQAEKEPELEAQLSVNDYIGRLQNAAKTAHGAARYGEVTAETECWVDIAAIAVARIEYLLQVE